MIKFNVDGSSRGNPGVSGIGGTLRDANGISLGFFSKPLGLSWAYIAEIKAILEALLFCKRHVIVESDSTLAVGWVMNRSNRSWKLFNDLNQIDMLMEEVGCFGVVHIYREANTVVDHLTKNGCDRSEALVSFTSWCLNTKCVVTFMPELISYVCLLDS